MRRALSIAEKTFSEGAGIQVIMNMMRKAAGKKKREKEVA